jgi:zinc D-Ala-D-Ala carboxypeptidase
LDDRLQATTRISPHFILEEFICPCCGQVNDRNARILALALEPVRLEYGPIHISSGFRCPKHNNAVGGALFSQHLVGLAADIALTGDRDRFQLVSLLLKHGFRRLGIAANYIHADIGPDQVDVIWTYYH